MAKPWAAANSSARAPVRLATACFVPRSALSSALAKVLAMPPVPTIPQRSVLGMVRSAPKRGWTRGSAPMAICTP